MTSPAQPTDAAPGSSAPPASPPAGGERPPVGVLLVNLGSPDGPDRASVRRFLAEFLGDPMVVDLNPVLWWLIRNLIVLPFRSGKSARLYQRLWTDEGSPLIVISARQRELVQAELGDGFAVELGMRYGNPSMESGLRALRARGCRDVVVLSMFPQYSGPTTGSVKAQLATVLDRMDDPPRTTMIESYPDDPGFVTALATRARAALAAGGAVDHHVFSFHGLPQRMVDAGDPYADQCRHTADALARELGLEDDAWTMVFQSRFGREDWLQPYADEFVCGLAEQGARRVFVTSPAFTADCLETVDELGYELRRAFADAGGEHLVLAECVNDDPGFVSALARLVRERAGQLAPRA